MAGPRIRARPAGVVQVKSPGTIWVRPFLSGSPSGTPKFYRVPSPPAITRRACSPGARRGLSPASGAAGLPESPASRASHAAARGWRREQRRAALPPPRARVRVRARVRRGCGCGCGRGCGGRSFGRSEGGGPEICKPLPGWKQDDREDHTETEHARGHRKGRGVTMGGRDRGRRGPVSCAAR